MTLLCRPSARGPATLVLALCCFALPASASPLSLTSCFCSLSSNAEAVQFFDPTLAPQVVSDPKGPAQFTTGASFLQSNAATEGEVLAQGRAEVDVTVGASLLAARGGTSMSLDVPASVLSGSSANASASITARMTFDVLVDSLFSLAGLVDTTIVSSGTVPQLLANNVMSLVRLDVPTLLFNALTDDEAFSVSGLLPAGRYRLSAESSATGSTRFVGSAVAESRYEFRLELTPLQPVPEPSAALLVLLAGGLLGALGARRHTA